MTSYRFIIKILFLGAVIGLAFWLGNIASDNRFVQEIVFRFGYLGVFLSAFVSGFNLLVPIPIVAFMPLFLVSGLNFWATIFAIVAGMTTADSIAYFVGRAGRAITPSRKEKFTARLEKFREQHQLLVVFILFLFASLAPMPNEILLVPLGFMGYRFYSIFFPVLCGNAVFAILYSAGVLRLFESIFL